MNHIHVSIITVLTWIFTAMIVGPAWRIIAIMNSNKAWGQALAFAGPGF